MDGRQLAARWFDQAYSKGRLHIADEIGPASYPLVVILNYLRK
jgi:hypothetical protein